MSLNISKIVLNDKEYYYIDDVKHICPIFFHGCAKSSRKLIEKRKIQNENYVYATFAPKSLKWSLSNDTIKSAKVLLSCDWVTSNVPGFGNSKKIELEMAPPLLELEDNEKFKDENGNIIEIETRGVKTIDELFFYGKDIEKMLMLDDISRLLAHETSTYEKNKHYKIFYRPTLVTHECRSIESNNPEPVTHECRSIESNNPEPVTHECRSIESNNSKRIFLTYFGLVKLLITRRHPIAEHFQKWATKILFTVQMGNENEKEELGTDILNISLKSYRSVFKSYPDKFPCIYLLELGKVKDLRETFETEQELKDDSTIYKFGFTSDMDDRMSKHFNDYGKLKNVNIQLSTFVMIDTKYTCEAEGQLRRFFTNFDKRLDVKNRKELIVLNDDELISVKREFKLIGIEYTGATEELQRKLQELKDELKTKDNIFQNELKTKDIIFQNELLKKDLIIQKQSDEIKYKELELKLKDMEIQLLKK